MTSIATKNGQFRLKSRPSERVSADNFEYSSESLKDLAEGEVLVRVVYLSLDPTNRIWMSDVEQYMPPVQIGEVMRGLGVGKVISSKNPRFMEGDFVSGLLGWQEYLVSTGAGAFPLFKLPDVPVPLQAMAGVAGMTGWTAYFGLLELGQPKAGETLVVSAAAGAVGSVVGQIGKIHGLKVVGIAGGEDKCRWLKDDLGFDAVIDRKKPSWKQDLAKATPDGVDINFENVGGEIMEAVYDRMNLHSRFVLCGLIAGYNDADDSKTKLSLSRALMKRIRIQGFIVTDFAERSAEASQKLLQWIAEGKLKHKETIVDGLTNAPEALNMLFDGSNTGKLLIKVSEP
ncbi:MAG: NADP-dependent oxidoreductase [Candidatus Obscuribacterales bacterium]|nr:NADP-dependent oxidoreductase [Candidatus Obscuribacterales bacterium]